MSDLITRKPTPIMLELLRRGAADGTRGIMTLADHNDRTQDGILRRDMAEVVPEDGATHSWLVINDRGRAYLAKLDGAQPEAVSAPETAEGDGWAVLPAPVPGTAVQGAYKIPGEAVALHVEPSGWGGESRTYRVRVTEDVARIGEPGALEYRAGEVLTLAVQFFDAKEPASAPQTAGERPAAPVEPTAPAGPALETLAKITEERVTIGHGPRAQERPAYVAYAYGKVHEFADMGAAWVEVCGRCAGEGVTPFKWVAAGVCFGCNETGLRPDIFSGTREERDAFVYAWAVKQDRQRRADEKRAARVQVKRLREWQRFEERHADLVAWCRSLAPDSTERVCHDHAVIEDTREEAARCAPGEEIIDGPRRLPADGPEGGRWWARLGYWETAEYFDSYGPRVAGLIRQVRKGFEPLDAKGAAFLAAVMRRAVEAQRVSRYAGVEGEQVSVTGTVRVAMTVEGRFGAQRLVIIEGAGADAGVTLKTYTSAGAAWHLEPGQEGVTVVGTVSRRAERSGERETTVKGPRISA